MIWKWSHHVTVLCDEFVWHKQSLYFTQIFYHHPQTWLQIFIRKNVAQLTLPLNPIHLIILWDFASDGFQPALSVNCSSCCVATWVMKSHTNAAPSFADANSSTQTLKQKKRQQKNKKLGKKRAQIAGADSHWSSGKICYVIRGEVCTGTKIQSLLIITLH